MKKSTAVYLLLSTFYLLALASASPTINFQHNATQPGETIFATISSEQFEKQIQSSDIIFYEGRKRTSFSSDIIFYNNTHYLYIYTTREGNFSIEIPNILYKENNNLKAKTLKKDFEVKKNILINEETNQTSTKILSIKPNFIFNSNEPKIQLTNRGESTFNLTYSETQIELAPLKSHEIILEPKQIFSELEISTYQDFIVPIIYLKANTTFISPINIDLKSSQEKITAELIENKNTQQTITLYNFAQDNLTNIRATAGYNFIEIESIKDIEPKGTQNITIKFKPEYQGIYQTQINITYTQNESDYTLTIPADIFILPKGSTEENFTIKNETCEELGGIICEENEICKGEISFTKNMKSCCLSTCEKKPKESSSGNFMWLLGIVIFAILALGAYSLYKKQKKLKNKTPDEKIKEVSENFSKRIKGGLTKS